MDEKCVTGGSRILSCELLNMRDQSLAIRYLFYEHVYALRARFARQLKTAPLTKDVAPPLTKSSPFAPPSKPCPALSNTSPPSCQKALSRSYPPHTSTHELSWRDRMVSDLGRCRCRQRRRGRAPKHRTPLVNSEAFVTSAVVLGCPAPRSRYLSPHHAQCTLCAVTAGGRKRTTTA